MSYGSSGSREMGTRRRTARKTAPKAVDQKSDKKQVRRKSPPKKSESKPGVKRLTEAQMKRLKEHSKQHKGGMAGKHMKKMMMVMTKEGKSFSEAHKIAMRHDKMKK